MVEDAGLAIDNQPNTFWNTQTYYSDTLNKAGVGLYIDAKPGTTARVMRVSTATPGFSAIVYARNTMPPLHWPDPGWTQVSSSTTIASRQDIHLTSGATKYRYWLLWISSLGHHSRRCFFDRCRGFFGLRFARHFTHRLLRFFGGRLGDGDV